MRRLSASVVLAAALLTACAGGDGAPAECARQADCGETSAACAGCPEAGDDLCLEGRCADRGSDEVSVSATVQIVPRQLEVTSAVHALVSMTTAEGTLGCASAFTAEGRIAPAVNVLAAGYKSLSGGPYHPDVAVGRAPAGSVALLLVGTDDVAGEGRVLATGCAPDLDAEAPEIAVELIHLEALDG